MYIKVGLILLLSFVYSIVRYNVFGPVEVQHIPVYVVNKAISVSAVIFLLISCFGCNGANNKVSQFYGRFSYHCALIHILLSLAIFSSEYYPKFFTDSKLSFAGEVIVLSGVLGLYCYWLMRNKHLTQDYRLSLKLLTSLMIAIHVFAMGFQGWFKVYEWHGYLPPISLISFLLAVSCLAVVAKCLLKKKENISS